MGAKDRHARILVVDDDAMSRKLTEFILKDEGYRTEAVPHVAAALEALTQQQPDLLILDVMMPGMDGFAFCQRLRDEGVMIPVIFVTSRGEVSSRVQGLELGGDDYLAKPFEPVELLARVQAVLRRSREISGNTYQPRLRVGVLELDTVTQQVLLPGEEPVILTPTETRLLECLMRHVGQIVTRDVLIEWVWGFQYEGESNRVEVYVRRLRQKLASATTKAVDIETARGVGYCLRPQEAAS